MQKIFVVLGLLILFLSLARLGTTQGQADVTEIATPVVEGVLSKKQKEHSKLYSAYKYTTKLTELSRDSSGNKRPEVNISILPALPELNTSTTIPGTDGLQEVAANSDLVVIATPLSKTSQLTEDASFVFTDYDLSVDEVLKNNTLVQPHSVITVTRPGGKILLEGRVISARDRSFKSLRAGGHYLLFLRYLPTTDSYQAVDNKSGFELVDNKVKALTEAADQQRERGDTASFLEKVKAAIATAKREARVQ